MFSNFVFQLDATFKTSTFILTLQYNTLILDFPSNNVKDTRGDQENSGFYKIQISRNQQYGLLTQMHNLVLDLIQRNVVFWSLLQKRNIDSNMSKIPLDEHIEKQEGGYKAHVPQPLHTCFVLLIDLIYHGLAKTAVNLTLLFRRVFHLCYVIGSLYFLPQHICFSIQQIGVIYIHECSTFLHITNSENAVYNLFLFRACLHLLNRYFKNRGKSFQDEEIGKTDEIFVAQH
ncbi:hypothetical protein ACJX0J_015449, partial [Zea mays]